MRIRTTLDYERLTFELQHLHPRKKLFGLLKKELSQLGYWRNLKRGNPKLGYQRSKHKGETP